MCKSSNDKCHLPNRGVYGIFILQIPKVNCGKKYIIEDLQEAGWSMKKPRENEVISDLDLRHIFEKVDLNQDSYVNRMVIPLM